MPVSLEPAESTQRSKLIRPGSATPPTRLGHPANPNSTTPPLPVPLPCLSAPSPSRRPPTSTFRIGFSRTRSTWRRARRWRPRFSTDHGSRRAARRAMDTPSLLTRARLPRLPTTRTDSSRTLNERTGVDDGSAPTVRSVEVPSSPSFTAAMAPVHFRTPAATAPEFSVPECHRAPCFWSSVAFGLQHFMHTSCIVYMHGLELSSSALTERAVLSVSIFKYWQ